MVTLSSWAVEFEACSHDPESSTELRLVSRLQVHETGCLHEKSIFWEWVDLEDLGSSVTDAVTHHSEMRKDTVHEVGTHWQEQVAGQSLSQLRSSSCPSCPPTTPSCCLPFLHDAPGDQASLITLPTRVVPVRCFGHGDLNCN